MIAKIDTPEARKIYGRRLAIVEPVFGNIRSQKRLDRLTLRGKIKVNIQWMLYCRVHNIEKIVHYGMAA
jgi:Transposase DDE domain